MADMRKANRLFPMTSNAAITGAALGLTEEEAKTRAASFATGFAPALDGAAIRAADSYAEKKQQQREEKQMSFQVGNNWITEQVKRNAAKESGWEQSKQEEDEQRKRWDTQEY